MPCYDFEMEEGTTVWRLERVQVADPDLVDEYALRFVAELFLRSEEIAVGDWRRCTVRAMTVDGEEVFSRTAAAVFQMERDRARENAGGWIVN